MAASLRGIAVKHPRPPRFIFTAGDASLSACASSWLHCSSAPSPRRHRHRSIRSRADGAKAQMPKKARSTALANGSSSSSETSAPTATAACPATAIARSPRKVRRTIASSTNSPPDRSVPATRLTFSGNSTPTISKWSRKAAQSGCSAAGRLVSRDDLALAAVNGRRPCNFAKPAPEKNRRPASFQCAATAAARTRPSRVQLPGMCNRD